MTHSYHRYNVDAVPVPGYRIVRKLGEGGFGEVWKAIAPGGTEVAIKVIDLTGDQGVKEFESLRLVKQIRHPHLIPIHAFWLKDEAGNLMDDEAVNWISTPGAAADPKFAAATAHFVRPVELLVVMGLGTTCLHKLFVEVQDRGHVGLPVDDLLEYVEGAAKGLDYLHDREKLVHGDIKPHNILLVGGLAAVGDFGLARAVEQLRKTVMAPVSVAYAPPESFRGKPEMSSDQYSLAITYIELRTGRLPFNDTLTPYQVMSTHVAGQLDLNLLDELEREVIARATAVDPANRWPSCRDMVRALRLATTGQRVPEATALTGLSGPSRGPSANTKTDPIARDGTRLAPPVAPVHSGLAETQQQVTWTPPNVSAPLSSSNAPHPALSATLTQDFAPPSRRGKWPLVVAVALLAGGAAGGAWYVFESRNRPQRDEPEVAAAPVAPRNAAESAVRAAAQAWRGNDLAATRERLTEVQTDQLTTPETQALYQVLAALTDAKLATDPHAMLERRLGLEPPIAELSPDDRQRVVAFDEQLVGELLPDVRKRDDAASKLLDNLLALAPSHYDHVYELLLLKAERLILARSWSAADDILSRVDAVLPADGEARLWAAAVKSWRISADPGTKTDQLATAISTAVEPLLAGALSAPAMVAPVVAGIEQSLEARLPAIRAENSVLWDRLVRIAASAPQSKTALAEALRGFLGKQVAQRLAKPLDADFGREMSLDCRHAQRLGIRSPRIAAALAESELELKSPALADDLASVERDEADGYVQYVRARILLARSESAGADVDALLLEAGQRIATAFARQPHDAALQVEQRRARGAAILVAAADTKRLPPETVDTIGGLIDEVFREPADAALVYDWLQAARRLHAPSLAVVRPQVNLAWAAWRREPRDSALANELTQSWQTLEAPALGDDALPAWSLVVGCAAERMSSKQLDEAGRRAGLAAFEHLLASERFGRADRLTDAEAVLFFDLVAQPGLALADAERTASSPRPGLDRIYSDAGSFIRRHKEAAWHFPEGTAARLETIFAAASELNPKLPDNFIYRGHAALDREPPDIDGALSLAETAAALAPDFAGAYGLRGRALIKRARQEPDRAAASSVLNEAIAACETAAAKCKASASNDDELSVYLIHASLACLEHGNLAADYAAQLADFEKARSFATEAVNVPQQRYPADAYEALGNACEDLAWITHHVPETNYPAAVDAFRAGREKASRPSRLTFALGRVYFRALFQSTLQADDIRRVFRLSRGELIERCQEQLETASLDPSADESLVFLGQLKQALAADPANAERRAKLREEADEHFRQAVERAAAAKSPNLAIWRTYYAQAPLIGMQESDDASAAAKLARTRADELRQTPPPPGETVTPELEAQIVEAWATEAEAIKLPAEAKVKAARTAIDALQHAMSDAAESGQAFKPSQATLLVQRLLMRQRGIPVTDWTKDDLAAQLADARRLTTSPTVGRSVQAAAFLRAGDAIVRSYRASHFGAEARTRLREALDDYAQAVERDPENAESWAWRMRVVELTPAVYEERKSTELVEQADRMLREATAIVGKRKIPGQDAALRNLATQIQQLRQRDGLPAK